MNENDLDNYKMPKLGREIARFFLNIARAVKASVPKRDGRATLRILRLFDWLKRHYIWVLIGIAVIAFGELWFDLIAQLRTNLFQAAKTSSEALEAKETPEYLRAVAILIATTAAALVAIATAPFALLKAWVNERTATTAEQGHITERMTKAIEQLGAEKTVYRAGEANTEPNLEVRLGAIYALERIAQDSERDHIPIMETLCAYVRQNTNEAKPKDIVLEDIIEESLDFGTNLSSMKDQPVKRALFIGLGSTASLRVDIRAVLSNFSRRTSNRIAKEKFSNPPFCMDFSHANLQCVDFSFYDLKYANMTHSHLEGAALRWTQLEGAQLGGAIMVGTDLRGANIDHASFLMSQIEFADLSFANAISTDFESCACSGARCRSTKFINARNVTQDQLNSMFGDCATELPSELNHPDHWSKKILENAAELDPEYDDWIARGAPPGKPVES